MNRGMLITIACGVAAGLSVATGSLLAGRELPDSHLATAEFGVSAVVNDAVEKVEAKPTAPIVVEPSRPIAPPPVVEPADPDKAPPEEPAEPRWRSLPSETGENRKLERAILAALPGYDPCTKASGQDDSVRYFYNYADLNGDGNSEAIVYLVGTYTCGTGGCTAMIFEPDGSGYQLNTSLSLASQPIVVSDQTTQGWKDLIIPVSGGGSESGYHTLRFDGQTYPSNASTAPVTESPIAGTALIDNAITFDTPAPTLQNKCDR